MRRFARDAQAARLAWIAVLAVLLPGPAHAAEPDGVAVRLELVAGEPLQGRLLAIDADTVRIESAAGPQAIAVADIRRVVRDDADAAAAAPPAAVTLFTTAGDRLSGSDFVQDGDRGVVLLPRGRIELPIDRVRRVAWLAAGETEPDWLDEIPERPAADLLLIRREGGPTFVECAVGDVTADSVRVVLDGETIPVKRAKVIGIEWLREASTPGGIGVLVDGGRLAAERIRWSPEALVLDDAVRLPADALRELDYAASRTTPLAAVPLEASSFEPFFGALAAQPEVAAFFAPRLVVDPKTHGAATLVARPRTEATWRVPAASRRFRATLERDVPPAAASVVDVSLAVDGEEVFRRRLGGPAADAAEPVPVELDLRDGRRLTLRVEFVAGDIGCGVRLSGGAFEK